MKKLNRNPKKIRTYFYYEKWIVTLVAIFGIAFNALQVFGPIMLGKLISAIANNDTYETIVKAAIIYLCVVAFVQVMRFFKRYFVRVFANRTQKRMRAIIYNQVARESLDDFEKESFGDLMSRCIQDVDLTVEGFRKALTEIFDTGVLMLAYFVTLMIYDYKITLISSVLIPLSMLIAYLLKGKIYKATSDYRKCSSKVDGNVYELISHSVDYRNYDAMDSEIDKFDENLETLKKKAIKANLLEGSMQSMYMAIGCLGLLVIIILGGLNVKNGTKSILNIVWDIGVFSAYIKLYYNFVRKSAKAAKLINTVQKAKISFKRIEPYLGEKIEDEKCEKIEKINHIEVRNMYFGYGQEKNIIGPINFDAYKGQIIAVCGKIASGKSSLGISLLGLYQYQGSIKFNDHELRDLKQGERSQIISYSGHNSYLLSESIKNNILMGEDLDLDSVLNDTCLNEDIEKMSKKENTEIGNNGIRLSGGQKQRVSLARALVNRNDVIILDDPFASLDVVTEKKIIKSLREKYQDSIVIIMSHRLTLLDDVDKVIYLDKVAKFDEHQTLLNESKSYRELYLAQVGEQK